MTFGVILSYSCTLATLQVEFFSVDTHFRILPDNINVVFRRKLWVMEHFRNQSIKIHKNLPTFTLTRKSLVNGVITIIIIINFNYFNLAKNMNCVHYSTA
jgi:hypothetical protein